jgi:hypothetical protein
MSRNWKGKQPISQINLISVKKKVSILKSACLAEHSRSGTGSHQGRIFRLENVPSVHASKGRQMQGLLRKKKRKLNNKKIN